MFSRLFDRLGHDDRGATMVVAMLVAAVSLSLGLITASAVTLANRDSGLDRQRAVTIAAAEAGIDSIIAEVQAAAVTGRPYLMPCRWPATGTADVGARPDVTSVVATVQYRMADGGVGCPVAPGRQPVSAIINSVAETAALAGAQTRGKRAMETEVKLTAKVDPNGYAIFTNGNLSVVNSFSYQESTAGAGDANLYVQGGFQCSNSAVAIGSVTVPNGGATLSNSCELGGTLRTRDGVDMSETSRVRLDVYSSRAGLSMSTGSSVGRDVTLAGAFTGDPAQVGGTVRQALGNLRDPSQQDFPVVGWDPATWTAAGFTVEEVGTDCERIKIRMMSVTTPTAFHGDCRVSFSNNSSQQYLRTDVAVVTEKGFETNNQFELASDTTTPRRLWLIDPMTTGLTPTCATGDGGISLSNRTNIASSIHLFLYSGCTIAAANQSTLVGQIYGGSVSVANSLSAQFQSVAPPGIELVGNPDSGYRTDVLYKQEVRAP
ncbi:MAG: hypothetical protein M3Q27_15450 [Actinomycetota bacterium]|nr:hypothetical protein [Actinomycetota bacterium]